MPKIATTVSISISVKPPARVGLFMVEPQARDRVLARRAIALGPLHAPVAAARAGGTDVGDPPRHRIALLGGVGRPLNRLVDGLGRRPAAGRSESGPRLGRQGCPPPLRGRGR